MERRKFLKSSLVTGSLMVALSHKSKAYTKSIKRSLKLSLNTYSFNKELIANETDLFELINFCKKHGFEAIEPIGYYFPGYPNVPHDDYLFELKRRAFLSGIEISGTGVRNDFANIDEQKREDDLKLIESWCEVASKIGAPLLRVFAGKEIDDGRDKNEVIRQVVWCLKEACAIAEKYGVMLALQNHNDFLISSEEITKVIMGVNSKWLGLHLDIGSLAFRDPYQEIKELVKYAITWQIKELVWIKGEKVPVDYDQIMDIIKQSEYVGYLPLETLNTDPKKNLPIMIDEIRKRL